MLYLEAFLHGLKVGQFDSAFMKPFHFRTHVHEEQIAP